MEGRIECYIRQKSGKCLWNQIKALDESIIKKKKQYDEMHQKYIQLMQYLKNETINNENKLFLEYDDGFKQTSCFDIELKQEVIKWIRCPYQKYDCQDLYDLKCRVLDYHTSKWTEQVRKYNTALRLFTKSILRHKKDMTKGNEACIYYVDDPFYFMMYAPLKKAEDIEKSHIELDVIYIQDILPDILQKEITCRLERKEEACLGTGLWNHDLVQNYLLKLDVPDTFSLILVKTLLQGIQDWVIRWNTLHIKDGYSIAGNYIDVGRMGLSMKKKWSHELKKLGYREIGRMNSLGLYEETQMLLHIEHSKKNDKPFKSH